MIVSGGCDGEPVYGRLRGAPPDGALWVLTYNVNFERPSQETVDAIAEADADVVFLQETHEDWEQRLRASLSEQYPTIVVRHAPMEGGMAILSKYPVEDRGGGDSPVDGGFPAWCASVSTPAGALDVLHVHLHPPLDEQGRLVVGFFTTGDLRYREIVHHLGCFDEAPDLVVGDFNEGEGRAIDHLVSLDFVDAQSAHLPLERTWSWDAWPTELEGRPDHVMVGEAYSVSAVQVVQSGGSDHRPLRAAIVPRETTQ